LREIQAVTADACIQSVLYASFTQHPGLKCPFWVHPESFGKGRGSR
jgi:hypothetical protein